MKTKILSLSYNAMFKSVFSNNKVILSKLIEAILEHSYINIDIKDKEFIIKNNESPIDNYNDKQLICDYIIKLDNVNDLNIELNRKQYPGVVERNMTYSFKIYYEHFNRGNEYSEFKKYNLIQVNFNKFKNPNNKSINKYYLLDANDSKNFLSKSICIINIDIEECYKLVYNSTKKEEISELEKLAAILYCDYLEDISSILESVRLDNMEKEKFINDINNASCDKNNQEAIKLEDNIEYRFELTEEEALNKGIKQGIAQNTINTIKNLLKKNYDIKEIASITNKSIEEIKEIEKSIKD